MGAWKNRQGHSDFHPLRHITGSHFPVSQFVTAEDTFSSLSEDTFSKPSAEHHYWRSFQTEAIRPGYEKDLGLCPKSKISCSEETNSLYLSLLLYAKTKKWCSEGTTSQYASVWLYAKAKRCNLDLIVCLMLVQCVSLEERRGFWINRHVEKVACWS